MPAICVLALAGCGGDEEREPKPGGAEPQTEAVTMSELKFSPDRVKAVADSTIAIHNEGKLGHDLKLRQDGKEIGGTQILNPGETQKLEVRFPAGSYQMYCSVPGHENSGMKGTFTVE